MFNIVQLKSHTALSKILAFSKALTFSGVLAPSEALTINYSRIMAVIPARFRKEAGRILEGVYDHTEKMEKTTQQNKDMKDSMKILDFFPDTVENGA